MLVTGGWFVPKEKIMLASQTNRTHRAGDVVNYEPLTHTDPLLPLRELGQGKHVLESLWFSAASAFAAVGTDQRVAALACLCSGRAGPSLVLASYGSIQLSTAVLRAAYDRRVR